MYISMGGLIRRVNQINQKIDAINRRLSDIDFNISDAERCPLFESYAKNLMTESSLLWDQKNQLIDQKNELLNVIKNRKLEEEMIANLVAEWMPDEYELIHTKVGGICVVISVKNPSFKNRKERIFMDENEKMMRKQQIDSRVSRLEKINDEWMTNHGESNEGIMQLINELMDERETLR